MDAHFIIRLKSTIVDMFMIYIPILYIITYFVLGTKEEFLASNLAPFISVNLYAIIYTILLGSSGQTIGKRAYDLVVVNQDDSKISFIKAFIRFYLFLFSAMSVIGAILPLFRKDNLTLHDIILKTKVIQKNI